MTVYVEYVLIDNFFIDLMLFNTAFKITGQKVSRMRLILCSAFGAAFAFFYPLIT
ncbi:MAG: sigma-E processing peptidase SpoIIGA, partial [Clostridia bacterium]|nr:sigma-E processing peptidase SpoIIGA [Clostridia bacterium]